MKKEKVAQAIWAELERQAKNVGGPLIISGTGMIDGCVDMTLVAEVAIQTAQSLADISKD